MWLLSGQKKNWTRERNAAKQPDWFLSSFLEAQTHFCPLSHFAMPFHRNRHIFRFIFEVVRYFAKNKEFGVQACLVRPGTLACPSLLRTKNWVRLTTLYVHPEREVLLNPTRLRARQAAHQLRWVCFQFPDRVRMICWQFPGRPATLFLAPHFFLKITTSLLLLIFQSST